MRKFGSLLILVALVGCQKSQELAAPSTAPGGGVRLEIQYNAIRALAHRGSDAMKDPDRLDVLAEMLDEAKQQQNFRLKLADGSEVVDAAEARTTVEAALKAIVELHRKRPDIDLARLHPAIVKLTSSTNQVLRQEAQRTQLALNIP